MMALPTHETNGNHKHRSDLTQIRGIGAIRKRWLHSLDISTIADLAQASAEAVEAQSKGDARFPSRDEVEGWIAQAQALQVSLALADASPVAKASTTARDTNPLTEDQIAVAAEPALETWDSIASFQVNYQTRSLGPVTEQRLVVQQLGTDAAESWSTFDTNRLQQWMRDRLEMSLPPLQTPLQTELAMQTAIAVEITQLRLMQPHYMRQPMTVVPNSPLFLDTIQTAKPFALEVLMQFVGLTDAHQGKQVTYRVQCLARNLATGTAESLSDLTTSVSLSDRSHYSVFLPSLLLRQPGTYRLRVLVTLQQAPAALGQFKVPMLQVV
ncbi:MAG: hypothetical protein RBJ76_09385 [Stenomitos frigidus ULC029]